MSTNTPSMAGRFIGLLFGFLGLSFLSMGQPMVCPVDDPQMTTACLDACIICDIDGFTGRHESAIPGVLPDDFCTFVVHNAQWIAFQAASTNLTIRLSVSNCQLGNGLEMGIYRSLDCNTFELISNCRGGFDAVPEGTSAEFVTTEPLVIGQYYYLTMDGNAGDNCDWTFEVLQGSTAVDPLTVTAPIQGPELVCPDVPQVFSTDPEDGAVLFEWTLDGDPVGDLTQPNVELTFPEEGLFTLCVRAQNACDESAITCLDIEVTERPPTVVQEVFCAEDCFEYLGETYCESGTLEFLLTSVSGCDSLVILELTRLDQPVKDLDLNLCEGDTITIGDTPYFETGTFTETLQTVAFCDSIIQLDLNVIVCNIQSNATLQAITCAGDSDGSASFSVVNGTPPFNYQWQHLQANLMGMGNLSSLEEMVNLTDLPAGDLIIEIHDDFGNADVLVLSIVEPEPLALTSSISDYSGFGVRCFSAEDGFLEVLPSGGWFPYQYQWDNGFSTAGIQNLPEGNYRVTVTDNLGCSISNNFNINQPDLISSEADFIKTACEGLQTGQINVLSSLGGTGTFSYSIDGFTFTDSNRFEQLYPGEYVLTVQDGNGCIEMIEGTIEQSHIPEVIGETELTISLGCPVQLLGVVNEADLETIQWTPATYLDCAECLDPVAVPLQSTDYSLMITSVDGCSDSLEVAVEVETTRAFFTPNAFTPNNDGVNDRFLIFGSKEVASIDLSIYDRWGGLVYQSLGMGPNDPANGWDGQFKGQLVNPGVYVWQATVQFIDGFAETYGGDVTVLR
ncbi:MAG: gliding motility-associated C-terminal domain-containing protein [Bacteroidota bacterium]